jgi:chromate reductase
VVRSSAASDVYKRQAIMSASPGGLGGLRGLVHLRSILGNINVMVIPDQKAISQAFQAFNPDGTLQDFKQQEAVQHLGGKLAGILTKLSA